LPFISTWFVLLVCTLFSHSYWYHLLCLQLL
jgi:hypothetical protein